MTDELADRRTTTTHIHPPTPSTHTTKQVARAVRALEELMATTIRPYLAQANGGAPHAPSLRFPGLGSFGSRVLFVRPCEQHGGTRQLQEVSRCGAVRWLVWGLGVWVLYWFTRGHPTQTRTHTHV